LFFAKIATLKVQRFYFNENGKIPIQKGEISRLPLFLFVGYLYR